ncbi:trypsin-like peptidase domain-containing protein [Aeromonas hydrophila]|uniref:trypsin-like peptidase domain-containing protein n=1 Tax=Aeromonas hydrophila TaxID=644 RepID=UPI0009B7FAB1|nr:trypsin-like peptidase domain-containing protein [Aeromonas hydrophila]MCO4221966.1 serine protease [Aeromonas hydrophila]OSO91513.1 hypothetical protein B7E00_09795 [Aeromonas hydrophila]UUT51863.1 serine protease [Aeromonas hydrophila]WEF00716.1 serine protease [Aeromonas hydrophila]CAD7546596.1 hypothetical protein KBAHV27_31580 [Aeromonas hydrophila]
MSEESFEHQISFITARIAVDIAGTQGTSIGTGFFYKAPLNDGTGRSITLLISNKHVFVDPKGKLAISLNRQLPSGAPDYGNIHIFEQNNFTEVYYPHPSGDVDLACINASAITHTDAFYKNLNDTFLDPIDHTKTVPSSSVIFVGYPENRYDIVHNLPLVRKGSIASLPTVDFNGKGQIVIDAQVFQGSSGSPVFASYDGRYYLLGVITETMIRHSRLQTLPVNLPPVGVQQILGLGITIKQRHVKELIDYAISEFIRRSSAS